MVDRRLGRGLDFFLSGGRSTPPPAQPAPPDPQPQGEVLQVGVKDLVPSPFQPRRQASEAEIGTLANSIRESGVLQPILVRRVGGKLEIIAGERRWRAAMLAGLEKVPALVRQLSDDESAVVALVENVQREDLNAIEKSVGFRSLMQKLGATQEVLAQRLGMERSTVANFLRLLDLPEEVQELVSRGTISMGHARTLLGLTDPQDAILLAEMAIKGAWTVRRLEAEVRSRREAPQTSGEGGAAKQKSRPVWLNELEETLVDNLATKVRIRYGRKRSQIVIECGNREDFERIYQRLKGC